MTKFFYNNGGARVTVWLISPKMTIGANGEKIYTDRGTKVKFVNGFYSTNEESLISLIKKSTSFENKIITEVKEDKK